ncbi:MAG TPA: diguanylate cyclase [Anaerolineae bacterium]|nr:diguanylate cyclase [Anaerolineae bacterium]
MPSSRSVPEVRQYVGKLPPSVVLISTAFLVLLLGVIDVLTGPEISLSVFYLFPIFVATWLIGRRAGAFTSVMSAITWRLADSLAGQTYSHPLIPYWNMLVRLGFFLVITFLLSELQLRLRRETDSARIDPLTGIANRRQFYEVAQLQIARAARHGEPFTVAYVDIDGFKAVNDRLGHASGDTLLSLAATTIQANLRAVDVVARMGGDEFAILLPHTEKESAEEALLRVSSVLSGLARDRQWPVTFSIGAVTFIRSPSSVDEMIRTADDLMYAAKQSGKGVTRHEVRR